MRTARLAAVKCLLALLILVTSLQALAQDSQLPFEDWLDAVDRVSEDTDEEADVLPLDLEAPTGSSSTLPTSST